ACRAHDMAHERDTPGVAIARRQSSRIKDRINKRPSVRPARIFRCSFGVIPESRLNDLLALYAEARNSMPEGSLRPPDAVDFQRMAEVVDASGLDFFDFGGCHRRVF